MRKLVRLRYLLIPIFFYKSLLYFFKPLYRFYLSYPCIYIYRQREGGGVSEKKRYTHTHTHIYIYIHIHADTYMRKFIYINVHICMRIIK